MHFYLYVENHLNRFGPAPGARTMMDNEMLHAIESIESGIYVS